MQLRQCRRIRGEAEEQAVAERQQPGVAEQKIEGQSHEREERNLGAEALSHADSAHGKRQYEKRARQDCERPLAHHSNFSKRWPINPRGRKSSTRIIRMYIDASAAGG